LNVMSYQFFYESGNDHWPILLRARAMNLMFSVGICVLVFFWARRIAGDVAGFAALALAAFSPTLLAHGPLATTDVSAALALTLSVGAFWWQLRAGGTWRLLLSAVAFGLACVCKFSAVLLLPIFFLLVALNGFITARAERRFAWTATGLAAHGLIAWSIIWACYGFRYTAFAPGLTTPTDQFIRSWPWMIEHMGWQSGIIRSIRDWRLLPEAFLFGYTHTYVGSLSRAAFLAGEHSTSGWRMFFPLAFGWKSTPAELAGALGTISFMVLRWRELRPWVIRLAPLLTLVAVYGVVAISSHLNIGHRHLLPMYPALFIVTGTVIARLPRAWWIAGALAIGQAFSALSVLPYELAYFNLFAGGPDRGWRLLADSSLDWGQDLGGLKQWLDRNNPGANAEPVFLSYFGSGEPNYYKIRATRMLFVNGFQFPLAYYEPTAGVYCISATLLQEVYSSARGPWTLEAERAYQELRRLEPQFREYFGDAKSKAHVLSLAPADQWQHDWGQYEILRHARLCAYLRARGPDANVGYSILIFRLSAPELDAALRTSYSDWIGAIERLSTR
jgi:4-amino-4-deoxy-L-arabinose transferase-like glycosyltransferase